MNQTTSTSTVPGWVRIGLVPEGWYDKVPGWDPRLAAAEPPFNAHLATDAGAGLLASGVALLVAAWLADRRSVQLASVSFRAFAVPHTAYHAMNPAPRLSSAEDAQNVATLVFTVLVVIALLTT